MPRIEMYQDHGIEFEVADLFIEGYLIVDGRRINAFFRGKKSATKEMVAAYRKASRHANRRQWEKAFFALQDAGMNPRFV